MKRRKKTPEEAASQPAPLQPAYFEAGEGENLPESRSQEMGEPEAPESASEEAPVEAEGGESAAPSGEGRSDARRPRRRRRGGRGRRRSGQGASAQASRAPAPAAAIAEEAAPAAPAAVEIAQPGKSKGTVVLAIGLPGSGKSSWFKRHNITPLSSDLIRALLFDDPTEQRFQDLVFSNLRSMLRARLVARRPMNYVDATNLTPHDRQSWIKLAKDFGYEVQAVYFDVPLELCLERNARRHRVVGEDVMRKMAAKLKPPTFEEGFSKITAVRVKAKE